MSPTTLLRTLHRPWAVWLALCVAVLGALVPTISHGLVRAADVPLVEICTSLGPRWVAISDTPISSDASGGTESNLRIEHCPFCLHSSEQAISPPNIAFLGVGVVEWQLVCLPEHARSFGCIAVLIPQPRGPPVLDGF